MKFGLPMRYITVTNFLAFSLAVLFVGEGLANETEVRAAINTYVTAFNSKDIGKVESLWSENAVYVDHQSGERTVGRSQIVDDIKTVFASQAAPILAGSVEHVRVIKDDVASVDGDVVLSIGDERLVTKFSAILLKQNGSWVIDSLEERAVVVPASAAEALQELNWLVGTWEDTSTETSVRTVVKPAIGGSFLIRSFETIAAEGAPLRGTQIIGWDPRAQAFRSWSFDADGSFGDGVWIKSENDWLIKSTQTLADGRAASGTFVMKIQDANTFTVQLIGREIEGELQPASSTVTVKRLLDKPVSDETPSK